MSRPCSSPNEYTVTTSCCAREDAQRITELERINERLRYRFATVTALKDEYFRRADMLSRDFDDLVRTLYDVLDDAKVPRTTSER